MAKYRRRYPWAMWTPARRDLRQRPHPRARRPSPLRRVPCRRFHVLRLRAHMIYGMPWSTCLWCTGSGRHASWGDSWNTLNISADRSLVNGRHGFTMMDVAHQIPSIFHYGINPEHHLFPLLCTVLKHWSRLGFIQPGFGKNSRTTLMCHPHLRLRISLVLHERFVVHEKQTLARCRDTDTTWKWIELRRPWPKFQPNSDLRQSNVRYMW